MTADDTPVGDQAPEQPAQQRFDPALSAFILLAKFLGTPAEAAQIVHDRGRGDAPFTYGDLVRIARKLGLVARTRTVGLAELGKLPVPTMLGTTDDGTIILLKVDDNADSPRYLLQRPDGDHPEIWSVEQMQANFAGPVLLLTSRERIAGDKRKFDVSWFIPALVKYRSPLRDVVIGSFFLQLVGLVSPVFFQLVIDKVLVHRSMTTLEVLAFGLAVVLIFETLLSGLRTWLFAHTTNRVDAELSASLFRHLIALPLSYFEARRVGDSVARVRELENIRQFLTSNAVTSGHRPVLHHRLFRGNAALFATADSDRCADHPDLRRDFRLHHPAAARPARRKVQARRREPGIPGRGSDRDRDVEGDGGRAADARPLGKAVRGLCEDRIQRHRAGNLGQPCDPAGVQADHGGDPVLRRQGGDQRRPVGRRAGRLQHARRPGGAADPAAVAAVAGFPAGAHFGRPARGYPQHRGRAASTTPIGRACRRSMAG